MVVFIACFIIAYLKGDLNKVCDAEKLDFKNKEISSQNAFISKI